MSRRRSRTAGDESGYALLLVFLMAAMIAISFYQELPRVAFESQRAKEQLLIERGEQYKRAIQVFVRKNTRYPATLDELESYNNQRYLRQRYPDPMTGKEKWRLIKVGPGGVLLDSINTKKGQNANQEKKEANTFIGEGPIIGSGLDDGQQQLNAAARRRRPSDSPTTTGPPADSMQGLPGVTGAMPGNTQPAYPGQTTTPGQTFPGQTMPGQPGSQSTAAGQQTAGSQPFIGGQVSPTGQISPTGQVNPMTGQPVSGYPGQNYPGNTGYPGAVNPQAGGVATPYSTQPGAQGALPGFPGGQPGTRGAVPGQGQNQAVQLIQQILTSPRPGGMPTSAFGTGGQQIGGGIAGVASTAEEESILVYNEHQKYNEWEFIYDMTKDRGLAGGRPGSGTIGTSASQMGQQPATSSGFGQSGFGQSGFGQSGFGQSQPATTPQSGFSSPGFGQTQPTTGPRQQ